MPEPRDERFLPAPYQSPWEALRRDLAAVVADLRLRAQETWRRNREGDLDVPAFWPRDLAPLFWPLILSLALLLVVAGALLLAGRVIPQQQLSEPHREAVPESLASERPVPFSPFPTPDIANTTPGDQAAPAKPIAPAQLPAPPAPVAQSGAPSGAEVQAADQPLSASLTVRDPLLVILQQAAEPSGVGVEAPNLVLAIARQPDRNGVQLTLAASWCNLKQSRRQALADQWLEQIQAAGYDELLLQSDQGDRWGRSARVGLGMVIPELQAAAKA